MDVFTACLGTRQFSWATEAIKPLAEISVGDEIYGTVKPGFYRRYVRTRVLAHWRTNKLAWRVRLEDGTELVASGDHRFLTERGWKFVAKADAGGQRPYLTLNNTLMGFGAIHFICGLRALERIPAWLSLRRDQG